MSDYATRHSPALQARRERYYRNPAWLRRREMYRTARGARKEQVRRWNHAWSCAGQPDEFPDLADWIAQQP